MSAQGDFHARSRFARPTIPEEKWGTTRSLISLGKFISQVGEYISIGISVSLVGKHI